MLAWLRRRPRPTSPGGGVSLPIALVRRLAARITSPQRAASVIAKVEWFCDLSPAEQDRELAAVYLFLEQYLSELDAAPVPRRTLRAEIRRDFVGLLAHDGMGIAFAEGARQELLLCRFMLLRVVQRAAEVLGASTGQQLALVRDWVSGVPHADPVPAPLVAGDPRGRSQEEDVPLLGRVAGALFLHLRDALGEVGAGRLFEGAYGDTLASFSALDAFPVVVGLLPDRLLDEEKIVLLSRRQVQRVVFDKVERLQEVNGELSHRNAELQQAQRQLNEVNEALEARIAERTRELRLANDALSALVRALPLPVIALERDGVVATWNPAAERVFGWAEAEVVGRPYPQADSESEEEYAHLLRSTALEERVLRGEEFRRYRKDGTPIDVSVWTAPLRGADGEVERVIGAYVDETERRGLEEQLRQSQKMQAVGRLAGGVAHDFNNLLTAIKGCAEFLLEALPAGSEEQRDAQEIGRAADRAAALTRQLLAFSRKQLLQPKVLDLNETVSDLERMLGRLIGEDVALRTVAAPELGRVLADPNQIEQVIVNLVVNARDAMPAGGSLTIETANVELDEVYARGHLQVKSGSYVLIAVSDTGVGMAPEVREQIFEPFFTTKEVGKGTGLGLSTVYGIVKQSGGDIWVYSEPGHGTTVKIYLPRVDAPAAPSTGARELAPARGQETVLLVEDDASVRLLARRVLERSGYTVLEGEDGKSGESLAAEHPAGIDLLLTDVVMPGIGGRELADRLKAERPGLRVLYMSGYTDDAVLRQGALAEGASFVEKPFTPDGLARRVREILDAPAA